MTCEEMQSYLGMFWCFFEFLDIVVQAGKMFTVNVHYFVHTGI